MRAQHMSSQVKVSSGYGRTRIGHGQDSAGQHRSYRVMSRLGEVKLDQLR